MACTQQHNVPFLRRTALSSEVTRLSASQEAPNLADRAALVGVQGFQIEALRFRRFQIGAELCAFVPDHFSLNPLTSQYKPGSKETTAQQSSGMMKCGAVDAKGSILLGWFSGACACAETDCVLNAGHGCKSFPVTAEGLPVSNQFSSLLRRVRRRRRSERMASLQAVLPKSLLPSFAAEDPPGKVEEQRHEVGKDTEAALSSPTGSGSSWPCVSPSGLSVGNPFAVLSPTRMLSRLGSGCRHAAALVDFSSEFSVARACPPAESQRCLQQSDCESCFRAVYRLTENHVERFQKISGSNQRHKYDCCFRAVQTGWKPCGVLLVMCCCRSRLYNGKEV
eukprot:771621-Pelagomonas_calceolata.AAC.2